MGCNNSRLNASGEVVPARIRPLLLRRIEELRKHRNGATIHGEGTLSKKQLLKDDAAEEDDDYQSSHEDHETEDKISRPKETQPAKEQSQQTVVRVVEKLSKVVPLPDSEYGTEEQHNKHEDHSQEKVKDVGNKDEVDLITEKEDCAYCVWPHPENKHEEANAKHNNDDDDHDDSDNDDGEEEEGEEDNENRRFLGPGSPSFRIYIEAEKIKEEERENQTIAVYQKSPSADSLGSSASASASGYSGNSNEVVEIESTTKRKGHKMKKLGAMKKNLLKVKKLQVKHGMNPMFSCAGSDRKSLLSPK